MNTVINPDSDYPNLGSKQRQESNKGKNERPEIHYQK